MTVDASDEYFEKQCAGTMYERILQQMVMIFSPLGGEDGLLVFLLDVKNRFFVKVFNNLISGLSLVVLCLSLLRLHPY